MLLVSGELFCVCIVSEAASATCNFVWWFSPSHSIQILQDCCLGPSWVWKWEIVDIDLFSGSQVSNVDLISGFSHFFTSIVYEFHSNLDYIHNGKRQSLPWPIFKVTGVKLWPNLGFVYFVRRFSPRQLQAFHSNFTRLLLGTIWSAEREVVDIDLIQGHRGQMLT